MTRGDAELGITGLTFDLLLELGRAAPELVAADALMDGLWRAQVVGTEVLTQRVKLLRRQLGDSAMQPRYLASRRGHGYRLLSPMVALPAGRSRHEPDAQVRMLYQQARAIIRGTHASRDESLRFLDRALQIDPLFAPARAYRALLRAGSVPLSGEPPGVLEVAQHDAMSALAADPDLPDAHVALGMVSAERRRWVDAEAHFAAALALAPGNAFVMNLHALVLLRPSGRLHAALAVHEESHRLAPTDGFTLHELVLTHSLLGNEAEALRFLRLGQTLSGITEPPWDVRLALSRSAARRGAHDEAARFAAGALPQLLQQQGSAQVIALCHAALAGEVDTRLALQRLEAFVPCLAADGVDRRTRAYFVTLLTSLGGLDAAFALLDRLLFAPVHPCSVELGDLWQPEMSVLRDDARFATLIQRLCLEDYWSRYGGPQ